MMSFIKDLRCLKNYNRLKNNINHASPISFHRFYEWRFHRFHREDMNILSSEKKGSCINGLRSYWESSMMRAPRRNKPEIGEEQCGVLEDAGTRNTIFMVRMIFIKSIEMQKYLYMTTCTSLSLLASLNTQRHLIRCNMNNYLWIN